MLKYMQDKYETPWFLLLGLRFKPLFHWKLEYFVT